MAEDANTYKRSRASGEVLDYLLQEFEANQNPTPDQRKEIAEKTGMSEKAVRIWFQNKRAKVRKFERLGRNANSGGSNSMSSSRTNSLLNLNSPRQHLQVSNILGSGSTGSSTGALELPIEVNDKYCFIDCSSLSVGSWQRIRTGYHDGELLRSSLANLSPVVLDLVMHNVDLLVILSKKNLELNYFFCAILNNSKILFRIFFPVNSIISCLLLDNNINKGHSELRLSLSHRPKFSVYFFNAASAGSNKWSICDDFSEGHQVSSAYYAESGTSIPHVLVGVKNSLQFLNSYILENKVYGTANSAVVDPSHQLSTLKLEDADQVDHSYHDAVQSRSQQQPHQHQHQQQTVLDGTILENNDIPVWSGTPGGGGTSQSLRHPHTSTTFSPANFENTMSPGSTQSPLIHHNINFTMDTSTTTSSQRQNASETPSSMASINGAPGMSTNGQYANPSTANSQATPQMHVGNSFAAHGHHMDADAQELSEMFNENEDGYFHNDIDQNAGPNATSGTIAQSTHIDDALMESPSNVHAFQGYTNSPFPSTTPFDYFEDPDKPVSGQVSSPSTNTQMDTFIDYLSHYVN